MLLWFWSKKSTENARFVNLQRRRGRRAEKKHQIRESSDPCGKGINNDARSSRSFPASHALCKECNFSLRRPISHVALTLAPRSPLQHNPPLFHTLPDREPIAMLQTFHHQSSSRTPPQFSRMPISRGPLPAPLSTSTSSRSEKAKTDTQTPQQKSFLSTEDRQHQREVEEC